MNRAVRTVVPVLVTSLTSTMPRPVLTSTRRPARVAAISYVLGAIAGVDHDLHPVTLHGTP